MDVASAKTNLERIAGLDSEDPLLDWINAARNEFLDEYLWPFLEIRTTLTTVALSDTVSLPADLSTIKTLKDGTNFVPLDYKTQQEFDMEFPNPTATGKPYCYTVYGPSSIRFYPIPDAAYEIDLVYQSVWNDLVDDGDLLDPVPQRYHYVVIYKAAAIGLQAESEEERSANMQNQYLAGVSRARDRLSTRQTGQTSHVQADPDEYA